MKPQYLWLDTETTGTDVKAVALLEVGAAIVGEDFRPISTFERVIHFDRSGHHPHLKPVEQEVLIMHTENGLWADAERSKLSAQEVDLALRQWATSFFPCGEIPLGGLSVWFDRRVAELHLPQFANCLGHKMFETGTLRTMNRRLGFAPLERADHPHRALRDVLGDLADVRAYMARFDGALP